MYKRQVKKSREEAAKDHPIWRAISNFAHPMVAPISVVIAVVALAGGVWYGQNLKIGDLDQGAPELHPDSRYNLDNDFVIRNY